MTTEMTTRSLALMVHSDRRGVAVGPFVLLIALLAALATACSSSHAAGSPASTATRPTSSVSSPVIVLVHGFEPDPQGYSCAGYYWKDLETAFHHWNPDVKLVTVGYSHGDHNCDMTIASSGPNTPIEDLGRKLATAVYQRFSARGIPVVLVGHSMGGLVVQSALAQAGSTGGPPYLLVPRAITISTPHGGTDALKRVRCFAVQCNEMAFKSTFLRRLEPDPQGRAGTEWTLFGSAHDPLVTPASSMGMPAAHRYLYEQPHYGHQGIINDPSPATNARRQEFTTGSPVVQSRVPHSLRAIFLATGATISRGGKPVNSPPPRSCVVGTPGCGPVPRCTAQADVRTGVVHDGFLVECGSASAVIRSGGWTHVFANGNCERGGLNGGGWLFFGVRTLRRFPHVAIVLYTPVVWHASRPYVIKGDIEILPGVSERVIGTAISRSDVGKGTFTVRGVRSGRTYTGSWNCGSGF